MPTPRSQLYRTVAYDGGADVTASRQPPYLYANACGYPATFSTYAHGDAGPNSLPHGPLDLLGLARQRIFQLETVSPFPVSFVS